MNFFKNILILFFLLKALNVFPLGVDNEKNSSMPLWGLIGYKDIGCYYFPQLEIYYCVPLAEFIFKDGDRWINSKSLPPKHKGVDLYRTFKVALADYQGRTPQVNYEKHKAKYGKISHWPDQETIGRKPPRNQGIANK